MLHILVHVIKLSVCRWLNVHGESAGLGKTKSMRCFAEHMSFCVYEALDVDVNKRGVKAASASYLSLSSVHFLISLGNSRFSANGGQDQDWI